MTFKLTVFGLANRHVEHVIKALRSDYGKLHLISASVINDLRSFEG
ncbi:MAG: hypothetical protein NZ938_04000 [Aigarchaeota archaeon]|nr:hypothetical protein [Candidatus Calditenuaceae archaeon]